MLPSLTRRIPWVYISEKYDFGEKMAVPGGEVRLTKRILAGIFIFFVFLLPARSGILDWKWSVKLSGGWAYLTGGDLNQGLQGLNDFARGEYLSVSGQYKKLHAGYDLQGELILNLSPHLGVALGAGYFQASKKSSLSYNFWIISAEDTLHPKINVIPFTLGIYYNFHLSRLLVLNLNAGLGYYWGKLKWEDQYTFEVQGLSDRGTEKWNASKGTIGFQGGLGIDFHLTSHLALVFEGFGRYAKLKGLSGDWTLEGKDTSGSYRESGERALWYFELSSETGKYPMVGLYEERPESSSFLNVHEAAINLSGFSVRAGVKFTF
jgi:hypothetical protein